MAAAAAAAAPVPAAFLIAVGSKMEEVRMKWCLSIGGVGQDGKCIAQGGDGGIDCARMLELYTRETWRRSAKIFGHLGGSLP